MWIYVVKSGDTVDSIALLNGVGVNSLIYANQIEYPYRLAVGQALLIPVASENGGKRKAVINGYAYPFIDSVVLEETLPYLTEMSVFSYGFTTEGNLIPPPLPDEWMIRLASVNGTASILTLTPFGEDGMFNNYLISSICNDQVAQARLIEELLVAVEENGFRGIDIDFEYILPGDRIAFAQFVENMRVAANARGHSVSAALAPKTSSDQPGLLYEGKDYALLGAAANTVLLMTYEWGYTYGYAGRRCMEGSGIVKPLSDKGINNQV